MRTRRWFGSTNQEFLIHLASRLKTTLIDWNNFKQSFRENSMSKVFYPFTEQLKSEKKPKNEDWQIEENYLNLWGYLRRRYPKVDLEEKKFTDLIELKTTLEGPHQLREWYDKK